MRRRWVLTVALVVLGLGAWLAFWNTPGAPSRDTSAGSRVSHSRSGTVLWSLFQAAPPAASEARLRIRGTVRGPKGPVPGAVVLASAPVAGESLSALGCAEHGAGQEPLDCDWKLEREQLLTLVAQRQGEAPVLARATTREDGTFTLEGLEAGRYSLWVESAEGTGLRHGVAAGEEGVELRLGSGVRLSGRVVDELEAPVPGALVTAVFMAHSRFFETIADESGRYSLGPMPPGGYAIVIAKEGLLASETTFWGYEREEELRLITLYRPRRIAGSVLLAGEPVAGAEVSALESRSDSVRRTLTDGAGRFSFEGVQPLSQKVIATHGGYGAFLEFFENDEDELEHDYTDVTLELAPATFVQGVVLDEARRPIQGASVQAQQESEDEFFVVGGLTDEQGRYRLGPGPVRPGPVSFEVSADGYIPLRDQTQPVPPGQATVDFILKRAALVEGVVVDAAGQPIVGARLHLRTLGGTEALHTNQGRTTGPDGRFSLDAPAPGTYRLQAGGRKMVKQVLEVAAPSSQRILAERMPSVMGVVVDEAGVPLPDVRVSLWPGVPDTSRLSLTRDLTDLQGRFSLEAPAEGRYRIAAGLEYRDILRVTSQGIDVDKGGAQVRLELEAGRRLSGAVVDRRGQPIEGAHISVLPALHSESMGCGGPSPGATTDSNGRFTFRGISGEQLTLYVWKDGFLDVSRDGVRRGYPLEPDERDVRLVLPRYAGVRGRFVSADGSPIMLFNVNGEERADEEGRFFLPIYSTGTMQLELSEPGSPYAPVRRTVAVQEEVGVELGTITLGP